MDRCIINVRFYCDVLDFCFLIEDKSFSISITEALMYGKHKAKINFSRKYSGSVIICLYYT